jgi:predicted esterase
MGARELLTALLAALVLPCARAAPCATDDFETQVTGVSQCLVMRRYGSTEPTAMVVWLHGDAPPGVPVRYLYPLVEKTAANFSAGNVMSVALLRPDFEDGTGASSTVDPLHAGRRDIYTQENILEVGGAIENLRLKYRPKSVIIVGHSAGAATAAVLLGMKPQLAEAAVLVGCPCELVSWRKHRGGSEWSRSENPTRWIEKISATTKVIALTGEMDDVTPPELARNYVDLLRSRGIDASFQIVPGTTHGGPTGTLRSAEVVDAIASLLPR